MCKYLIWIYLNEKKFRSPNIARSILSGVLLKILKEQNIFYFIIILPTKINKYGSKYVLDQVGAVTIVQFHFSYCFNESYNKVYPKQSKQHMQFRASEKAVSLFSGELLVSMDTAEFPSKLSCQL